MKQFARCSNCRQWYVDRAVTTVDILRGNGMRRTALWCHPCIREVEQRSRDAGEDIDVQDLQATDNPGLMQPEEEATGLFGELQQEHLDLMEEALLEEDDDAIASRVGEFVERSRAHLKQFHDPEQVQRLTNHLNYWQTFLTTLQR